MKKLLAFLIVFLIPSCVPRNYFCADEQKVLVARFVISCQNKSGGPPPLKDCVEAAQKLFCNPNR